MTTTEPAAKKDVQKLQRAIVDGLEDVKAQNIVVFNTEHLSPLFERVIVASGTSNRQTKALSASVRDAVRDAGFAKPRIEGEENGEWIIVDCGPAVVHIMQPTIREYYRLEEIWGEKPVRLKHGADKAAAKPAASKTAKTAKADADATAKPVRKSPARKSAAAVTEAAAKPAARKAAVKKTAASDATVAAKPTARKTAVKAPAKTPVKAATKAAPKAAAKKTAAAAKPALKAPAKKPALKAPVKTAAKASSRKAD